jgi:hypothetical protein
MVYVKRDELVGCRVSLIGPARTNGGVLLDDGTTGTIVGLSGLHGSHRARVVVKTDDGVEFACRRDRLIVKRLQVSGASPK